MFYFKISLVILPVTATICHLLLMVQKAQNSKEYLKQGDLENQRLYDIKKNLDLFSEIDSKNKFLLSWEFIYSITEKVTKSFTQEDKKQLNQIGKTSFALGLKYQHVLKPSVNKKQLIKSSKARIGFSQVVSG